MPCPFSHATAAAVDELSPATGIGGATGSPPRRASRPPSGATVAVAPALPASLLWDRVAARAGLRQGLDRLAARVLRKLPRGLDGIDRFALVLLGLGLLVLVGGMWLEPPGSLSGAVRAYHPDWAPGLITDGLLLLVVNSILRRHERRRVLSQIGSLSREFALDAVRRARSEGWLSDGSLAGFALSRARLSGVDLSGAALARVDLSFASLSGASLAYADLRGTDLTGADLSGADLRWTDLSGAGLQWADLRGALLEGSTLDRADGRHASVDPRYGGLPAFEDAVVGGFLDESQIAEVRRTFDLLAAAGTQPIERFYARLFEAAPEVRGLFTGDLRAQARKLLQSLKVIVSALDAPQKHVAVLQRLGERHQAYGVRPQHYDVVGTVLLDVLGESLGDAFTPEARTAWRRAFDLMATVMIGSGARGRGGRDADPWRRFGD